MDPVSAVERDFIVQSAKDGIRIDGRSLTELRDISIELSRTYTQSSSVVSYGETKVCAITNCELVPSYSDRPNEGIFTIHVNLTPMGGREYNTGIADDVKYELQRILERSLKDNNTVDVESLCIIPGERVFSVHCYISVIDNNGNIFDAAVLAATSSLSYFRRPDYSIDGTQVHIYDPREKEPVPICLHYQPLCLSFCLLNDEITLLDPNEREEGIMEGKISLVLNSFGELCGVHFLGGIAVSQEILMRCMKVASVKVIDISKILKEALAADSS